ITIGVKLVKILINTSLNNVLSILGLKSEDFWTFIIKRTFSSAKQYCLFIEKKAVKLLISTRDIRLRHIIVNYNHVKCDIMISGGEPILVNSQTATIILVNNKTSYDLRIIKYILIVIRLCFRA